MMVNPPIQLEPGYYEFRVNWDEVGDGYDKAAMLKAAEAGPMETLVAP